MSGPAPAAADTGNLIGTSVRRPQDPRLLTGNGRYIDDLHLRGMLHATIVRSAAAHAEITAFDATEARQVADLVLGPEQINEATDPLPGVWVMPGQRQVATPIAPADRIRHAGQALGIVVAGSRAQAEDAAELLHIDLRTLPAVADQEDALRPDAPLLYPDWGSNRLAELEFGTTEQECEAVFATAATIVERRFVTPRVAPSPIETRGVVASWDPGLAELTFYSSTQAPHHIRDLLAGALRLRTDQVRVIARDLGGGFGLKERLAHDEVMVALASMRLGRPVKWIEDRTENLSGAGQARDAVHYARLALDADANFLAISVRIVGNSGAHISNVGTGPFQISATSFNGAYRFAAARTTIEAVVTNTPPTGAYRGFGNQESAWTRERIVDEAARELGVDPVELRLKNMIPAEDLPYAGPYGFTYDSGDYRQGLTLVREAVERWGPPARTGPRVRIGTGYAQNIELTGVGSTAFMRASFFNLSGYETAETRVEPDGTVVVRSAVMSMGQGIETALAQIAATKLGVPMDAVRVELGDTKTAPYGSAASIASRSAILAGTATAEAAEALTRKIKRIAAHQLEADPGDIVIEAGRIGVRGTGVTGPTVADIARDAWLGWNLPPGETPGLETRHVHDPNGFGFAYATHAARVQVDLDTGKVTVTRYCIQHDSGTLINPTIVDGQAVGGMAQGLGIALLEKITFGEGAQPTAVTFMDYLLPMNSDVPPVELIHTEHPAAFNSTGIKGCGEGGVIPTPPAIANAVAAAVPEIAHRLVETPLTPYRIWGYLREAGLTR
jgi:carbon-monoxide dehydrogenase large subunit